MINDLIEYFKGKKVLILGFGREGVSTYKLIRKYLKNQQLYIADARENFQDDYEVLKNDEHITFISGKNYLNNLNDYDIIMKSPGISFAKIDTKEFFHKIKSQLELLLEFLRKLYYRGYRYKGEEYNKLAHLQSFKRSKCKMYAFREYWSSSV